MVPLETALERVVTSVEPLASRTLPLLDADDCVLAEDCIAMRTKPPFAVSAMDGYAVASAPLAGDQLEVVGEVPAGSQYSGKVGVGHAVRIFTGAPIPDGGTHVLIQEETERTGDIITVSDDPGRNANIRPAGGDFTKGDTLIAEGTQLTPQHLALAASGNHAELLVHPKPSVAVMMNGDELAWPDKDAPDDAIIASNGFALATLAQRYGAKLHDLTLIRDDQGELEAYIAQCEADVLVTIGGASVGDYDLIRPALEAQGYALDVPKVALRPGKPTLFGRKGAKTVLGLPGNPVSSMVSAMLFLRPLIDRLAGRNPAPLLPLQKARLAVGVPANGNRAHFMRAISNDEDGIRPVSSQDSSLLRLLGNADVLLYRSAHAPALEAGSTCETLPLPR
ncbi:MAG: molybdopterin molybdotransferase MoeA [Rhizobiales bacterium]|nr:molybdopterin molybdotransferase MoeA [Hyphomicrobiales bacterium]MBO6698022.1 molybdopterin molybdotransferase MoeA [Hyphomicrobiales bacterium]MBO6735724.1 molybdopterin molybdotransferase MoeA [Hyphomicrobiales bacterium]MBO6910468.1 molybdopterin molybdotransferase MoeA [Hyphomicrobiales bacterium]MBO6957190.1 molybdopterin molybdotransferase MoeA [Hyphomicrobiales bacterium]